MITNDIKEYWLRLLNNNNYRVLLNAIKRSGMQSELTDELETLLDNDDFSMLRKKLKIKEKDPKTGRSLDGRLRTYIFSIETE